MGLVRVQGPVELPDGVLPLQLLGVAIYLDVADRRYFDLLELELQAHRS